MLSSFLAAVSAVAVANQLSKSLVPVSRAAWQAAAETQQMQQPPGPSKGPFLKLSSSRQFTCTREVIACLMQCPQGCWVSATTSTLLPTLTPELARLYPVCCQCCRKHVGYAGQWRTWDVSSMAADSGSSSGGPESSVSTQISSPGVLIDDGINIRLWRITDPDSYTVQQSNLYQVGASWGGPGV